jgi:hypothetical protein
MVSAARVKLPSSDDADESLDGIQVEGAFDHFQALSLISISIAYKNSQAPCNRHVMLGRLPSPLWKARSNGSSLTRTAFHSSASRSLLSARRGSNPCR